MSVSFSSGEGGGTYDEVENTKEVNDKEASRNGGFDYPSCTYNLALPSLLYLPK